MRLRTHLKVRNENPWAADRPDAVTTGAKPAGISLAALIGLVAALVMIVPIRAADAAVFTPVADTYVDSLRPATNYGTKTYLLVDNSPVRTGYLRFDASAAKGTSSAQLQIFAETSNSTGFEVRTVSSTTWGETTVKYDNAPTTGDVVATTGRLSGGNWYNLDVSSAFAGDADGVVSFALTTTSSTSMKVTSREGANPPRLVVPAPPVASHYLVTRSGSLYVATSGTTGTVFTGTLKSVVENAVKDLGTGGGGTVEFAAGTFDFGSEFLKFYNIRNIVFQGAGIDTTILQNSNDTAADTEPFNVSGAFGVTIRDMTVAARGSARTTSDALDFDNGNDSLVERVKITASRGRGIIFDGKNTGYTALNNVVRSCVITGTNSDGIELLAASDNLIEGCTITNVGGHGIQIVKSSATAEQANKKSNDNVVTGNVIDNSGEHGIDVGSSDRNQISSNTITNSSNRLSSRDGIRVSSSDSVGCDDNRVNNNVATDNQVPKTQKYGLNINSSLCRRTVVTSNDFSGNLTGPIRDVGTNTIYL